MRNVSYGSTKFRKYKPIIFSKISRDAWCVYFDDPFYLKITDVLHTWFSLLMTSQVVLRNIKSDIKLF